MSFIKIINFLLILIILVSCVPKKSNDIIAFNKSDSIQLTQKLLNSWLQDNPEVANNKYDLQIESYFIQHSLLANKDSLGKLQNEEIDFVSNLKGARKANGKFKNSWKENLEVDEVKIDELYSAYKQNYDNKSYKVRIYQIFKRFSPNANEYDKQNVFNKMIKIRDLVHDLDSFKSIARVESNSQTRLRDGLIGNVGKGIFDSELESIVLSLNKGEFSDIIKTKKGYVLFYCERRVPKIIRQDEELYDIAYNKILSQQTLSKWPLYLSNQLQVLEIDFNWERIRSNINENNIVVTSNIISINKTQLLWLLNEDINHYELSEFNNDTIIKRVENYLLSQYFYSKLSPIELIDINHYINHTNINTTTTAVLLKHIQKKFKKPTDQELKQYYVDNMTKYFSNKKVDFSYIALNLKNKAKEVVYNQAEDILFRIKNKSLSFNDAVKLYCAPEKKLKKNSTGLISIKQSSGLFGINVNKQLRIMKQSNLSDLVESDSGYVWILRLNKIKESEQESFSSVKEKVNQDFGNYLIKQLKEQVYLDILDEEKISIKYASYNH